MLKGGKADYASTLDERNRLQRIYQTYCAKKQKPFKPLKKTKSRKIMRKSTIKQTLRAAPASRRREGPARRRAEHGPQARKLAVITRLLEQTTVRNNIGARNYPCTNNVPVRERKGASSSQLFLKLAKKHCSYNSDFQNEDAIDQET